MTVKRLDTVYPNQKEDIERELAKNESDITQSQGKNIVEVKCEMDI